MSKVPPVTQEPCVVLDTPIQIQGVQISTIKMGLKALQRGMMITRGANAKFLLTRLSQYTGKKYKSRDLQQGIDDCEELIRTITAAIHQS